MTEYWVADIESLRSTDGFPNFFGDCDCLVVKETDSWPAFKPSTTEDPLCSVEMHVKSVDAQASSRWCGVEKGLGSNPRADMDICECTLKSRRVSSPLVRLVTATAGSDVVQSGRPIFDDLSNICGRISAITRRMLSSKWSSVCGLSA
ncbi:hypothetical protein TNCV_2717441 [Trichonephila clavipes]|nr:hypothetical protein TNCV_2717441 [Trichonephila clavipes]